MHRRVPRAGADAATARSFIEKNVVLVFFSGSVLRAKLSKICTFFALTRYRLPEVRV